jgi:hypothetical protein
LQEVLNESKFFFFFYKFEDAPGKRAIGSGRLRVRPGKTGEKT